MQKTRLKFVLCVALILALCLGFAPALQQNTVVAATDYYGNITATSGTELLGQLHDLIVTTHTKYTSYAECGSSSNKTHVAKSDPGSNSDCLIEFYTNADIELNAFDVSGGWNREHVWPKANSNGLWKDTVGGGADLHHIRPAEKDLNNARGNYKFGEVSTKNSSTERYTGKRNGYGGILGGWLSSSTFEPLDDVKGDVARILFYVYTHYNTYSNVGGTTNGNGSSNYFGTLNFTDNVIASKEDDAIEMLLRWNALDPVDDIERTRNNYVATLQGNRNPFIDNPNYAEAIWGDGEMEDVPLTGLTLDQTTFSLAVGATQSLTVVATPSNATKHLVWTSSDNSVATVSANGLVTAVSAGTATITARDTTTNISAEATVNVKNVTKISLSGTPNKTNYHEGDTFNPQGITVTATYSDGSTSVLNTSDCQWLDGTKLTQTLNFGSTTVVCKYGSVSQIVSGISVSKATDQTVTITIADFVEAGYGHQVWENGELKGLAYVYTSGREIQFNSNRTSHYFATTTTLGQLVSVTVFGDTKDWELLTSSTPYSQPSSGDPTNGTSAGIKQVTSIGTTWELDGSDSYFTLNYKGSGVVKLTSVEITYSGGETTPPDQVSLEKTSTTLLVGETETLDYSASGSVSWNSSDTSVATVNDGVVSAVGEGEATITAICGEATATCTVTVSAQEQQPEVVENKFTPAVSAIANATTREEKFNAIKQALTIYNSLTEAQQAEYSTDYETLQSAIEAYNAEIAKPNTDMQSAMQAMLSGLSLLGMSMAALVMIVKKLLRGEL